jgi:hypothetical protein
LIHDNHPPSVVVQGNLIEVDQTGDGVKLQEAGHIQYFRTNVVGEEHWSYQIDVITERFLPDYLALIEREREAFVERVQRHEPRLRRSVGTIAFLARHARTPEERLRRLRLLP